MAEKKLLKKKLKTLKKKMDVEPHLFARIASIEMELGRPKAALKVLEKGLDLEPDYNTARILLAKCYGAMNQPEESLHQWKIASEKEPQNQAAMAGYIDTLSIVGENPEALRRSLFDLYRIDPLNIENERRLKNALMTRIAREHPDIKDWPEDWHPGDFTYHGNFARKVSEQLNLTPMRSPLPRGYEPKLDLEAVKQVVESQSKASEEMQFGDAMQEVLAEPHMDEATPVDGLLVDDQDQGGTVSTGIEEGEPANEKEMDALSALFNDVQSGEGDMLTELSSFEPTEPMVRGDEPKKEDAEAEVDSIEDFLALAEDESGESEDDLIIEGTIPDGDSLADTLLGEEVVEKDAGIDVSLEDELIQADESAVKDDEIGSLEFPVEESPESELLQDELTTMDDEADDDFLKQLLEDDSFSDSLFEDEDSIESELEAIDESVLEESLDSSDFDITDVVEEEIDPDDGKSIDDFMSELGLESEENGLFDGLDTGEDELSVPDIEAVVDELEEDEEFEEDEFEDEEKEEEAVSSEEPVSEPTLLDALEAAEVSTENVVDVATLLKKIEAGLPSIVGPPVIEVTKIRKPKKKKKTVQPEITEEIAETPAHMEDSVEALTIEEQLLFDKKTEPEEPASDLEKSLDSFFDTIPEAEPDDENGDEIEEEVQSDEEIMAALGITADELQAVQDEMGEDLDKLFGKEKHTSDSSAGSLEDSLSMLLKSKVDNQADSQEAEKGTEAEPEIEAPVQETGSGAVAAEINLPDDGDLSQDDISQLFQKMNASTSVTRATPEPVPEQISPPAGASGDDEEFSQDDISKLFQKSQESAPKPQATVEPEPELASPPAGASGDDEEFSQDDISKLFQKSQESAPKPQTTVEPEPEQTFPPAEISGDDEEFSQDDISKLFQKTQEPVAKPQVTAEPEPELASPPEEASGDDEDFSQDDISKLFQKSQEPVAKPQVTVEPEPEQTSPPAEISGDDEDFSQDDISKLFQKSQESAPKPQATVEPEPELASPPAGASGDDEEFSQDDINAMFNEQLGESEIVDSDASEDESSEVGSEVEDDISHELDELFGQEPTERIQQGAKSEVRVSPGPEKNEEIFEMDDDELLNQLLDQESEAVQDISEDSGEMEQETPEMQEDTLEIEPVPEEIAKSLDKETEFDIPSIDDLEQTLRENANGMQEEIAASAKQEVQSDEIVDDELFSEVDALLGNLSEMTGTRSISKKSSGEKEKPVVIREEPVAETQEDSDEDIIEKGQAVTKETVEDIATDLLDETSEDMESLFSDADKDKPSSEQDKEPVVDIFESFVDKEDLPSSDDTVVEDEAHREKYNSWVEQIDDGDSVLKDTDSLDQNDDFAKEEEILSEQTEEDGGDEVWNSLFTFGENDDFDDSDFASDDELEFSDEELDPAEQMESLVSFDLDEPPVASGIETDTPEHEQNNDQEFHVMEDDQTEPESSFTKEELVEEQNFETETESELESIVSLTAVEDKEELKKVKAREEAVKRYNESVRKVEEEDLAKYDFPVIDPSQIAKRMKKPEKDIGKTTPEIAPEDLRGPITKTFAKICIVQGRLEHARVICERLLKNDPDDQETRRILQDIQNKLSNN